MENLTVKKEKKEIPRAEFPEQVGVSSKEIGALIRDFDASGIEVHSITIIRGGKVACELYRYPFNEDSPHTMYSVSKSFTSIAVGFAIDEGYFSLDTKVIDVFPEYRPKKYDEDLEKLTVYHLLTMTAGRDVSLISDKTKGRWVRDFFASKQVFSPGEGWRYISENAYICCAIIKRTTGMGVIDFLTPRLFEPLGIYRRPFWETDPQGVEAGGWGLFVTSRELSKFIFCLQQGGKYLGRRVIPAEYAKRATSALVDNGQYADRDARNGYGFLFWRNELKNSYRADGMFSQFGIVFEDYDAAFIMTCAEVFEQRSLDCVFRHCPHMFSNAEKKPPEDAETELALSPLPNLPAAPRSVVEEFIKGRVIRFVKNPLLNAIGRPLSVLPLAAVYMSANKTGNIDDVIFDFSEKECSFTWNEGGEHNTVVCGMDGKDRRGKIRLGGMDFTTVASAAWKDDSTLELWIRPLETVCERRMVFSFRGNNVVMRPSSVPALSNIAESLKTTVSAFISNETLAKIGGEALTKLDAVVEAPLFGKLI